MYVHFQSVHISIQDLKFLFNLFINICNLTLLTIFSITSRLQDFKINMSHTFTSSIENGISQIELSFDGCIRY